MNALVTGASGFIGSALVERLVATGDRVIALTRRPDRAFPPGVTAHVGDLVTGAGIIPDLLRGVEVVFHCAGELADPAAMTALHVGGTRALLDLAVTHLSPIHWVQLSSVGAYGPASPPGAARTITEASPEAPRGPYETTKTQADHLVRETQAPGLTWTILRPSNVIGARMPNASLRALVGAIRKGHFFYIGGLGAIATYVHVDDVAAALIACARDPRARGQVFNLSSDCSLEAVVDRAAATLHVRPPGVHVPAGFVRAAIRLATPFVPLPLTLPRIDALTARTAYPSDRIVETLGFRFSRPLPAAVDDIVSTIA